MKNTEHSNLIARLELAAGKLGQDHEGLGVLLTEAAQELRHLMSSPAGNGMSDMEIALRTAASVLRDSVESGRMPSGAWLTVDVKLSYENAARQLERLASHEGALLAGAAREPRQLAPPPAGDAIEAALRAAIDALRDSLESGRMPSGKWLTTDARVLQESAMRQLEQLASCGL
ncbi:hypothetical protein [Reyranella sp.]|jgi:hypothetical protein|uniref:hypothetical protein n=1 Tax=Reyranella sp. TaxID=1929291 RepID=UPI000BD9956C|nr:hypothetical protein [Reyranella sp.]OYY41089.1 MAG: hypothetical protein B7Y57_16185 [Rhodospirillales bacterium 35-66-84]OYZ96059.1 MAG: hypothetical protein B7Y08_06445 [Rhodospirillales bacterium 24-66-33]OZB21228.1 MAG: hypothetical protein B7X63_28080 [Rhodospirillales bacterium 39-66-50]HQS14877.1 hypothetical protein [Reyranella sp.]HQT14264.1 hypothetical protein [Reyranella sp.]